jgi:phage shock protein C
MTQPAATPPYKQLRRPTTDRMIAGVASGLGRYFNVDPTVVRVAFAVIAVITWGTALLAYPVMWFLIPEETAAAPAWPTTADPVWTDPADPAWGQPPAAGQPAANAGPAPQP